ncbi:MAG: hypothetical protein RLZZ165_95 [Bacteroidota bacterium]
MRGMPCGQPQGCRNVVIGFQWKDEASRGRGMRSSGFPEDAASVDGTGFPKGGMQLSGRPLARGCPSGLRRGILHPGAHWRPAGRGHRAFSRPGGRRCRSRLPARARVCGGLQACRHTTSTAAFALAAASLPAFSAANGRRPSCPVAVPRDCVRPLPAGSGPVCPECRIHALPVTIRFPSLASVGLGPCQNPSCPPAVADAAIALHAAPLRSSPSPPPAAAAGASRTGSGCTPSDRSPASPLSSPRNARTWLDRQGQSSPGR